MNSNNGSKPNRIEIDIALKLTIYEVKELKKATELLFEYHADRAFMDHLAPDAENYSEWKALAKIARSFAPRYLDDFLDAADIDYDQEH